MSTFNQKIINNLKIKKFKFCIMAKNNFKACFFKYITFFFVNKIS